MLPSTLDMLPSTLDMLPSTCYPRLSTCYSRHVTLDSRHCTLDSRPSAIRHTPANPCSGEILSSIFTRPKEGSTYRIILNLKSFNKCIPYQHFKMDTLKTVLNLIEQDCVLASLDLKDAYYSVPVARK